MNENSAPKCRYWAFISYSSKDAALSERLYRRLESYAIPRALVGRPGRDGPVPKRLFPCFRDRDELPLSADLSGSIQNALRASGYLIVICTPDSAQSRWVNEEIRYFKSLGRSDRILAIIAAGEPHASDQPTNQERECFGNALRHKADEQGKLTSERTEPLAGDLRAGRDGWTNTFLKAVAGTTGLGLNAFLQREARRRRKRRLLVTAGALLCLGVALWWWDYTRLKTAYYQDVVTRWSVPEGITPLPFDKVWHRATSYRFESSRRQVRRVTQINGSNRPINNPVWHDAPTEEIHYRENGDLDFIAYLNPHGREVFRETYSDFRDNDAGADGIARKTRRYDERGYEIEEAYFGTDGRPVLAQSGYAKISHEYDGRGNQIEDQFFGVDDRPIEVKGACRIVYTYGETASVIKIERFNSRGKLIAGG